MLLVLQYCILICKIGKFVNICKFEVIMKILFILDDFPPYKTTSASSLAFDYAKYYLSLGHRVSVITSVQEKEKAGEMKYCGIKIYRLYAKYNIRWQAWLSLFNPQTVFKVKKVLKKEQPDIVHFHHIHYYLSYHIFKYANKYAKAVFLTAHDVMLFHYGKMDEFIDKQSKNVLTEFDYKISWWQLLSRYKKRFNPFRNIIIRHYLKYIDRIIVVSNSLADALKQNKIENIKVIHNGLVLDNWQLDQSATEKFQKKYNLAGKQVVLFGGRMSALKGGAEIIKAMRLVARKNSGVVLLVVGQDNAYAKYLKKLSRGEFEIILTGWLDQSELKAVIGVCDVVTTPSICLDTFNLLNAEAMICAKPVVGTCFGGTPEVVKDKETGFIINPLIEKMLADKILYLLENKKIARQMGEAGKRRVEKMFNLADKADKTLKLYLQFIGQQRKQHPPD